MLRPRASANGVYESVPGRLTNRWRASAFHPTEGLLLALILSLTLLALNPNWVFTNPFTPPWFDPFVYQGVFMHPAEYIGRHPTYYPVTRIPWIAFGSAFYAVLPPVAANIALKLTLAVTTAGLFYAALRTLAGPVAAVSATILLLTYPYFIMTMGWDYIDGPVSLLLACCYYAAIHGALREGGWHVGEFLAGTAFAALIVCNLLTVVVAPAVALFYLAVLFRAGRVSGRSLWLRIATAILGLVVGLVLCSLLNAAFGGSVLLLVDQFRGALSLQSGEKRLIAFESWAHLLPVAGWLAMPVVAFGASLAAGGIATVRILRGTAQQRDLLVALVAAHYLLAFAIFALVTLYSMAMLLFWFYTSFLYIPAFLALGCALGYAGGSERVQSVWLALLTAVPLLAIHLPKLGLPLQQYLGFSFGSVPVTTSIAWVAAGIALLFLAKRPRFGGAMLAGAAVLAVGYLSLIVQPQLNFTIDRDRKDGFRAILAAVDEIRSVSANPRRFLWVDRSEPDYYGGIFHAASIQSLLSSRNLLIGGDQTTRFPELPPHGFQAADPVVILTSRGDWLEAANAKLASLNLALRPVRTRLIAFGETRFEAVVGELVPAPDSLTSAIKSEQATRLAQ